MNAYKVKILKKEFPFLEKLFKDNVDFVDINKINKIEVKRGDKALLTLSGYEKIYGGGFSFNSYHDYSKFFAVCGEKIVELDSTGTESDSCGYHRDWVADSIGEQLLNKGINPDFIVLCSQNDLDANGCGEITRFWTIYKMDKFDLLHFHRDQIDQAAACLKAEMEAVCLS